MNRLVQGDVGSGKTLVAMAALYLAARSGWQGAMMAPTEVLASQLYQQASAFLAPHGIRVGCMISGMGAAALRRERALCASGDVDVVIGTHALIQDSVSFARLALVVTDEQHRFGVQQRAALREKAGTPHMLVMSATPVPRTLGLLLFADLDLSRVDELPPGRKPVQTRIVSDDRREDMYRFLAQRAREGRQCYIVCPAIEPNEALPLRNVEEVAEELKSGPMKDIALSVLHGRLSSAQKEAVLASFRSGATKVLVSTTVIEVGINVPNATVMVIEDAGRFGLSQLHQLRGRVGRGEQESFCFLMSGAADGEALGRLRILSECSDGFRLAEEDLKLRGPGDFLGTRQAGTESHAALLLAQPRLAEETIAYLDRLFADPEREALREQCLRAAEEKYADRVREIVMN